MFSSPSLFYFLCLFLVHFYGYYICPFMTFSMAILQELFQTLLWSFYFSLESFYVRGFVAFSFYSFFLSLEGFVSLSVIKPTKNNIYNHFKRRVSRSWTIVGSYNKSLLIFKHQNVHFGGNFCYFFRDFSPFKALIMCGFVSAHIMKTKQNIKLVLDFSAIC